MGKRVTFWGAGKQMHNFIDYVHQHNEIFDDQFVGIVDSCQDKVGSQIGDFIIEEVDAINDYNPDYVVVTPVDSAAIFDSLEKRGVSCSILSLNQYKSQKIIQYQVKCNSQKEILGKTTFTCNDKSIVVYTAISKGYDVLLNPAHIIPNAKYICFTDDSSLKSDIWDIKMVDFGKDSKLGIRKYKVNPHLFFSDADISIWTDGNLQIIGDLSEYIEKYFKSGNILLFPHQSRYCIYDEAAACITYQKAKAEDIIPQILSYRNDNYPYSNGLYLGGCIVRQHNCQSVIETMELWWKHICTFSQRDQISLPYALWKTGLPIDLCDENLYENQWIRILGHNN